MTCENARMFLAIYDEEELSPETILGIEKHLAQCSACRNELANRKNLIHALPPLPERSESYWQSYTQKILQRIEEPAPILSILTWRWATALTLLCLIAGVSAFHEMQKRKEIQEVITHLDLLQNLDVLTYENFDERVIRR